MPNQKEPKTFAEQLGDYLSQNSKLLGADKRDNNEAEEIAGVTDKPQITDPNDGPSSIGEIEIGVKPKMAQGGMPDEDEHAAAMRIMTSGKYKNEEQATPVPGPEKTVDIYDSPLKGHKRAGAAILAADGAAVMPDMPQDTSGYQDKLNAVLSAMGMGAKSALGTMGIPSQDTANTMVKTATPVVDAVRNGSPMPTTPDSSNLQNAPLPPIPPSTPTTPQPISDKELDLPAAVPPMKEAPATPTPPKAQDILTKLTDGDGAKMQALLASLQDQDKKNKFANALAIIGDTFGNMGQAKAGQTPEGFKGTEMIQGMHEKQRALALDQMTKQLMADPNSQTSKMAQSTLMQAMGIKPGDPRATKIASMPASSIVQMMPQMTDAVKNNIEKEKNLMESKKADVELGNQELARKTAAANAAREAKVAESNAANEALKNVGPIGGIFNPGVRSGALETLKRNMGGGNGGSQPMTATNKMGHRIQSNDGGKTWQPI